MVGQVCPTYWLVIVGFHPTYNLKNRQNMQKIELELEQIYSNKKAET